MDTLITQSALHPPADVSRAEPVASWGGILAGAFVAAGVSLIILSLGAGLGFAAISPWSGQGVSARTFTVATAIWLLVTQWIAAALGGYVAGRLCTRWPGTHRHEAFFRDTAHGLVMWAVATMSMAVLVALIAVSGGRMAVAPTGLAVSSATAYEIDKLFRPTEGIATGAPTTSSAEPRLEAEHIIGTAANGSVSADDRGYLATLVAATTGATPEASRTRVDQFVTATADAATRAKAAAQAAAKAASQTSLYTALALLIGAFIAGVAAALGGHLRDEQS
jgi:hypothetical protein